METLRQLTQRIDIKKEQLDACRPLPPELVKHLDEWFTIELTYSSNALEGKRNGYCREKGSYHSRQVGT